MKKETKICTDIQQSETLALMGFEAPHDMEWAIAGKTDIHLMPRGFKFTVHRLVYTEPHTDMVHAKESLKTVPCWCFDTLMDAIPEVLEIPGSGKFNLDSNISRNPGMVMRYRGEWSTRVEIGMRSPLDTAYEMVKWLLAEGLIGSSEKRKADDAEVLRDLSGRLPYGVWVKDVVYGCSGRLTSVNPDGMWCVIYDGDKMHTVNIRNARPYLIRKSCMLADQRNHLAEACGQSEFAASDYMNRLHVDGRGMIDRGLAVEVDCGGFDPYSK